MNKLRQLFNYFRPGVQAESPEMAGLCCSCHATSQWCGCHKASERRHSTSPVTSVTESRVLRVLEEGNYKELECMRTEVMLELFRVCNNVYHGHIEGQETLETLYFLIGLAEDRRMDLGNSYFMVLAKSLGVTLEDHLRVTEITPRDLRTEDCSCKSKSPKLSYQMEHSRKRPSAGPNFGPPGEDEVDFADCAGK